jgi:hypothetical protein
VEDDAEGLEERTLCEAQGGRELVQKFGVVSVIPSNRAVIGMNAGECNIGAKIVDACRALLALSTWHARFDGNAVADVEILDVLPSPYHNACSFVTENVV